MDNAELIEIDDGEYAYLSEKFEIMSVDDTKNLPKYILYTRKRNLKKIIDLAIENELDGLTGMCIKERYFSELPVSRIAENHGINRYQAYRLIEKGSKTLFTVLKYAYFCGFSLINPPKNMEDLILMSKTEVSNENYKN